MKKKIELSGIKLDLKLFLDFLDPELWAKLNSLTTLPLYSYRNQRLFVPEDLLHNDEVKSLLLQILKEDDWEKYEGIDMKDYSVDRSYVESYLTKVNKLQDEQCKKYQQQLILLVYYAVATRFYIEKTIQKLPIISTKVSHNQALADYETLKRTPGSQLDLNSKHGKQAVNFYMEDVRFECHNDGNTYGEYWNNPILIGKLVTWMKYKSKKTQQHTNSINRATFNRLRNDTVVSPFRPAAVKYLVHYIHQEYSDIKISSYLNLCGGWGCRLLGALSTPEISRYIQTDPNPDLLPISEEIYKVYDPKKETEVHFYNQPMEDLTPDQLCPENKKNQFIFFSPPFHNKEKYKGKDQSHERYPKVETWCNDFLYKSLQVSYFSLDNGVLAINLADISTPSGKLIKLTDCLVHMLDVTMAKYFTKLSEPLVYPNRNTKPSYIYLYKTKPYHDSLEMIPKFAMNAEWIVTSKKKSKVTTNTATNQTLTIEHHSQTNTNAFQLQTNTNAFQLQTNTNAFQLQTNTNASNNNSSEPFIERVTLAYLHKIIDHFNTLEEVAAHFECSALSVIKRISDWDLKLSYSKLKYDYASSEYRSTSFYSEWNYKENVIYIDNQPFNPKVVYINFLLNHENNLNLMQVICLNPHGKIVNQIVDYSSLTPVNTHTILDYLSNIGLIKKWICIPHYNECKSKRPGAEYLLLTLEELHEIILSEQDELRLIVRLGKSLESLELDFAKMGLSLNEFKSLNRNQASMRYGNQYKECIGTIIRYKEQQQPENEPVSIVNEVPLEEKVEAPPAEEITMAPIMRRPPPRISLSHSSLFIPKKTKRTQQEDGSNKKPRI